MYSVTIAYFSYQSFSHRFFPGGLIIRQDFHTLTRSLKEIIIVLIPMPPARYFTDEVVM